MSVKGNNIDFVVQKRRCMSCGMCKSICPTQAITITFMNDGFFRPKINNNKCVNCGRCLSSCPAEHQSFSSLLLGEYIHLYLAHSCDKDIRHNATSGGVINSLLQYLLDKDIVNAVLLTRYSAESVIEAEPVLLTKETSSSLTEQTRDFASRYVLVPILSEIKNQIMQYKRLAIVGTPCQTNALTLLSGVMGSWDMGSMCGGGGGGIDIFKIGITCSGGMSYKATEEYKRSQCLEISKMYYRGDGWPGKNCLISSDKTVEFEHQGSLFERMFSSQIFKNPGCRNCMDHFAEEADISFCDFWDRHEMAIEKNGNSCVVIRSERAEAIFSKMLNNGFIKTVRELNEEEIIRSQYQVLLAKKGNIRGKKEYRLFVGLSDIIFRLSLYKQFDIKTYRKFCSFYNKICRDSHF